MKYCKKTDVASEKVHENWNLCFLDIPRQNSINRQKNEKVYVQKLNAETTNLNDINSLLYLTRTAEYFQKAELLHNK